MEKMQRRSINKKNDLEQSKNEKSFIPCVNHRTAKQIPTLI